MGIDNLNNYWLSYLYGKSRQYIQPYLNTSFHINMIINNLYIGDLASSCNLSKLKENGITHIVTCIRGVSEIFPNDFKYLLLDIGDNPSENINKYFNDTNLFIDNAINNGGNVLIHCMYGISRSATIACSYLMYKNLISKDDAINIIKDARPIINPNNGFIEQLIIYENYLNRDKLLID